MNDYPRRGEIWLVNLEPALGAEIKKTRPGLVVSHNGANQYSGTVTVLPITDQGEKVYPFETALPENTQGLKKISKIKCQHIRALDKQRFLKKLGSIEDDLWDSVEKSLKVHLDLR